MSYRRVLRELAFDTHGVITVKGAAAVGVPAVEVRKLAARGALTRVGHGVYLMDEAPRDSLTEFAVAVALVGDDAVLVDESVLAAHELAQVNLRRVRVASGQRVRRRLPSTVELVHLRIPPEGRDEIDGIPAMRLDGALLASRGRVMTARLVEATRVAVTRGLLNPGEAESVIAELERSDEREVAAVQISPDSSAASWRRFTL